MVAGKRNVRPCEQRRAVSSGHSLAASPLRHALRSRVPSQGGRPKQAWLIRVGTRLADRPDGHVCVLAAPAVQRRRRGRDRRRPLDCPVRSRGATRDAAAVWNGRARIEASKGRPNYLVRRLFFIVIVVFQRKLGITSPPAPWPQLGVQTGASQLPTQPLPAVRLHAACQRPRSWA